ncbi:MAG TPA: pyridoxamine 5'-phosphate oxidase [Nocardioidaceae bacterium]
MDARELSELRREYAAGGLDEADLAPDPVSMFRTWMHDAVRAGLHEPNAFVLATSDRDGLPGSRIVLLKGLDERGFVFFTNYSSRKGEELASNPRAALLFPWHPLERQVRVEGTVNRLSDAENDAYFATRPRAAQLGAWASPQSQVVPDRAALDRRYDEVAARFGGEADVPRPEHWGGYCVEPATVEFWQGRIGRMHDRLRYRRSGTSGTWTTERLAP